MALLFAKNNSLSAVTALPASITGGGLNLISTQTASSSSTIDFTSGIDSTYKEYIFKFYDLHPSANAYTRFQGTTDGTNFNTTITSTTFAAYHDEGDSFALLEYRPNADQAQGTALQPLNYADSVGTDNDMCFVGTLHLFDPSNTTFVKHFISTCNSASQNPMPTNTFIAGYFNTTSPITGIRFQQNTGTIDIGTIKLYGVT